MMKLTCPICGGPASAIQPIRGRGRQWNVGCNSDERLESEACGLVLFGDEGESRNALEAKWRKMRSAEPIISVEPPE